MFPATMTDSAMAEAMLDLATDDPERVRGIMRYGLTERISAIAADSLNSLHKATGDARYIP